MISSQFNNLFIRFIFSKNLFDSFISVYILSGIRLIISLLIAKNIYNGRAFWTSANSATVVP